MKNQKLIDLYNRHASAIYAIQSRCAQKLEGPFLIAPNESYWSSPIKVAFVGQETNGWSSERDIALQMDTYRQFNLGESYYSSPFWNVIRKCESSLTGAEYSSAWLNLHRYDQEGGRPSPDNQSILAELDFLLLEELKLLSPDIVVFFTGPRYDDRITALMNTEIVTFNDFSSRQFGEIRTPELKARIFRTYHPKYLRLSGLEDSVIQAITSTVATNT